MYNNEFTILSTYQGSTGSGKTALAVKIAQQSGFPFVKITSKRNIPRHSDQAKVQALDKVRHIMILSILS